jgi:two-component system sensor histidine kinase AlgZ
MALANIRERLSLHFDAEAGLRTTVTDDAYQVHIVMPYRTEPR